MGLCVLSSKFYLALSSSPTLLHKADREMEIIHLMGLIQFLSLAQVLFVTGMRTYDKHYENA